MGLSPFRPFFGTRAIPLAYYVVTGQKSRRKEAHMATDDPTCLDDSTIGSLTGGWKFDLSQKKKLDCPWCHLHLTIPVSVTTCPFCHKPLKKH